MLIKNSRNLTLQIGSKINKIIIFNSTNINIKIKSTVSGIDIDNCMDINITPVYPYDLKLIHGFKSSINLNINKDLCKFIDLNPPFQLLNEFSSFKLNLLHE